MSLTDIRALFLGSNSENESIYESLFTRIIHDTLSFRKNYHAQDNSLLTEQQKHEPDFLKTKNFMLDELNKVLAKLKESVPTWDMKYMAHFHGDLLLPAIAGYVASILYNPNNVTDEASSATLPMEMEFMEGLAEMIGYKIFDDITKKDSSSDIEGEIKSWGHLTSGGTVANIEAIWVARNLKYVPLSFKLMLNYLDSMLSEESSQLIAEFNDNYLEEALPEDLNILKELIGNFNVTLPDRSTKKLTDLSYYQLFNLDTNTCLSIKDNIIQQIKSKIAKNKKDNPTPILSLFEALYRKTNLRSLGLAEMHRLTGLKTPKILISRTCHNTWDKMPEILGLGQNAIVKIDVDENYHINTLQLDEKIKKFIKEDHAVLAIIGVFGSTEEGALDPIHEIVELKKEAEKENFSFSIHIDAAYGGYYASIFNNSEIVKLYNNLGLEKIKKLAQSIISRILDYQSGAINSESDNNTRFFHETEIYLKKVLNISWIKSTLALKEADSIVIDPHKLGYVPYPAGSVIYKDSRIREQTSFDAPYLEWKENKLEWSGVKQKEHVYAGKSTLECSRPGAASAACYLAFKVLPLNPAGYGKLISYTLINSSRFVSVMNYFNESYELNHGFKFQQQFNKPDTNVMGWIIGMPHFIERPEYISMLVDEVFSGMAKFRDQSVFSYNYFVSKTKLDYKRYSHLLIPLIQNLITSKENLLKFQKSQNFDSDSVSILRSVLMNPLLFYVRNEHFIDFWQQQLELAKKALPKMLLKLLEEKNDGNRLEIIWLENEVYVKQRKQRIQYESLLGNHINIEFILGNSFNYVADDDVIYSDGEKATRTSLVSNKGIRKIIILDMNLVSNEHLIHSYEKVQPTLDLLGSINEAQKINQAGNSTFIIPCSEYFTQTNSFSESLKKRLKQSFGIEEKYCVAKPKLEVKDSNKIDDFSFELVKRIFLAADNIFN